MFFLLQSDIKLSVSSAPPVESFCILTTPQEHNRIPNKCTAFVQLIQPFFIYTFNNCYSRASYKLYWSEESSQRAARNSIDEKKKHFRTYRRTQNGNKYTHSVWHSRRNIFLIKVQIMASNLSRERTWNMKSVICAALKGLVDYRLEQQIVSIGCYFCIVLCVVCL